jgi:hypothetical protein
LSSKPARSYRCCALFATATAVDAADGVNKAADDFGNRAGRVE